MGRSAMRRVAWGACLALVCGCNVETAGTGNAVSPQGSSTDGDPITAGDGVDGSDRDEPSDANDAADDASDGDTPEVMEPTPDEVVRLDELQLKGTLDSYHLPPAISFDASTSFGHRPLAEQLSDQHVRAFELAVHQNGDALEVYNRPVVDAETLCRELDACLAVIRDWSDAHPAHLPIVVKLDVRDSSFDDPESLDAAIGSVFADERVFTPDELAGDYESPRLALEAEGWPTLSQVRGKVLFVLSGPTDVLDVYTNGSTTLAGRTMFAQASASQYALPWAAITSIPDPMQGAVIRSALNAGMLVLSELCDPTMTDDACIARRDAAFANGPHVLFDTYPAKVDGREYWLDMAGGGPARCNAMTASDACAEALGDSN